LADQKSDEPVILARLVETIGQLPIFTLHFEIIESARFFENECGEIADSLHSAVDLILERSTNVLSVIHPHIYFPTYSNGLKDIGRFLRSSVHMKTPQDCRALCGGWTGKRIKPQNIKARLLQYNQDDCRTLNTSPNSSGA